MVMVIKSLLQVLRYAEDLFIGVKGRFEKFKDTFRKNSSISAHKVVKVLFTNKHKLNSIKELQINGCRIVSFYYRPAYFIAINT